MKDPIIYRGQTAEELFGKREEGTTAVAQAVSRIIADVRARGDEALREYSEKFDGYTGAIEVTKEEFDEAKKTVDKRVERAMRASAENIKKFHSKQKREGFEIDEGVRIVGQKVTPCPRASSPDIL